MEVPTIYRSWNGGTDFTHKAYFLGLSQPRQPRHWKALLRLHGAQLQLLQRHHLAGVDLAGAVDHPIGAFVDASAGDGFPRCFCCGFFLGGPRAENEIYGKWLSNLRLFFLNDGKTMGNHIFQIQLLLPRCGSACGSIGRCGSPGSGSSLPSRPHVGAWRQLHRLRHRGWPWRAMGATKRNCWRQSGGNLGGD